MQAFIPVRIDVSLEIQKTTVMWFLVTANYWGLMAAGRDTPSKLIMHCEGDYLLSASASIPIGPSSFTESLDLDSENIDSE